MGVRSRTLKHPKPVQTSYQNAGSAKTQSEHKIWKCTGTPMSYFTYVNHVHSLARSVFLCARFCQPFSSLFFGVFLLYDRFFSILVDSTKFRPHEVVFVSSSNMPRNMLNSVSASLDLYVPTPSMSGESAPSTTSASTSSSSFTSLPSSVTISAETLTQAISQAFQQSLPQMLVPFRENGVPNSSSSTSGNSSAASSTVNVPLTHTSTSTGCRSSSLAGSVTVP